MSYFNEKIVNLVNPDLFLPPAAGDLPHFPYPRVLFYPAVINSVNSNKRIRLSSKITEVTRTN